MPTKGVMFFTFACFLVFTVATTIGVKMYRQEMKEAEESYKLLDEQRKALIEELQDKKKKEAAEAAVHAEAVAERKAALEKSEKTYAACRQWVSTRADEYLEQNGKEVPGKPGMYRAPKHVHDRVDTIMRDGMATCDSAFNLAVQRYGLQYGK